MDITSSSAIKFNDMIDGTVKPMDEWLETEIYRLRNNIKPRHFENYCQLVEMVHEDTWRYQAIGVPPPITAPPEYIVQNLYDENEDDCNDQMGEEEDEQYEESCEEEDPVEEEPIVKSCINNQQKQYTTQSNKSIIPNHNNINSNQQHHQAIMIRQPTWLCRTFIEIMHYCRQTKNNQAPSLLLIEFGKLSHDTKLGKRINIIEFREKLQKISFGKIQMTEHLAKVWRLMCDWVTKLYLNNYQHALKWVNISVNAYLAAQRLFITEVMVLKNKTIGNKVIRAALF